VLPVAGVEPLHARSLGSLEKARAFGMTSFRGECAAVTIRVEEPANTGSLGYADRFAK
jgi:hypothetical protein